jgi:hypothetical protein
MKKKLEILMLLSSISFSNFSFAQNLVPNWSFEDTVSCPDNSGQVDRALGWSSYRFSPDYFNICAPSPTYVSVPLNFGGSHYPKTGNAYAGFIIGANAREYVGTQLSQPLNIGELYYVSFYACRAGSIIFNRASNKIGARFSTVEYSVSVPEPIPNDAQVYTDSIVKDTLNWVRISGVFTADSSYEFLSIGNFFSDSLTTYLNFDSTHVQSYYYVDDIIVSPDSNCCPGVSEISENEKIKIYPNPTHDQLEIETREVTKVFIYDVLGKFCVSDDALFSSYHKINISNLENGIYFLFLETSSRNYIRKLIIE